MDQLPRECRRNPNKLNLVEAIQAIGQDSYSKWELEVKEKPSLKWFLGVKPQFDAKDLFEKVDFLQRSGKAPLLKEKLRNGTLPVAHQLKKQGTGDGISAFCYQMNQPFLIITRWSTRKSKNIR